MTVKELTEAADFTPLVLPAPDREIDGAYIGDLLSWVMGRAKAGALWLTIMSNVNVLAVASLADVSAVIMTEDVRPDEEIVAAALDKGINLLSTPLPAYEAVKALLAAGV